MDLQVWAAVVRVLTYAVIAPGFVWFCFDYWQANRWLSVLFLLLATERVYVLASVSFDFGAPGSQVQTLDGLAPIVLFMAVVMARLWSGRLLARGWEMVYRNRAQVYRNG